MKIHGTAKGAALSTKDFGVAFGGAAGVTYPDSLESTADLTNSGCTLNETDQLLGTGCLSFDRDSGNYVDADGLLTFSTTVGSISFWAYTDSEVDEFYQMAFADASADTYLGISNDIKKAAITLRVGGSAKWTSNSGTNSWTLNAWHHICLVQDGTAIKWYFDGSEITSFSVDTDKSAWLSDLTGLDNVRIGCRNAAGQTNVIFNEGLIDSMCFWNTAISSSMVTELYSSGSGLVIPSISSTTGIRAFYSCDNLTLNNEATPT